MFSKPCQIIIRNECASIENAFQNCVQAGFVDEHTIDFRTFGHPKSSSFLYLVSYIAMRNKDFSTFDKGLPDQTKFVCKHSKLWISNVLKKAQKLYQKYSSINFRSFNFMDVAVKTLADFNNTAFIAQDTRVRELESVLKSEGVTKIYVGKEVLSEWRLGFYFKGWVPVSVQSRIRSVHNSEILGWWNKIAAKQVPMQVSNKTIREFLLNTEKKNRVI